MANRENKSTNFFETHSFIFTSILIPIFHKIIKIFYIKYIAKYYELDTYYFEHITLDYFFSTMIIFTIFLFLVNYYNIYLNSSSKIYISIFLLIIFSYYILGIFTIINHNIFSQEICIFFTCIVILLILALKNFYPWYILCSTLLSIIEFHQTIDKWENIISNNLKEDTHFSNENIELMEAIIKKMKDDMKGKKEPLLLYKFINSILYA